MSSGKKVIIAVLVVVGILVVAGLAFLGWYKGTYERFIKLDQDSKKAWANVESKLQRRYDLIPNLVNTVKGYAQHEEKVLTEVTDARSRVGSAQTIPDKIHADQQLTSALGRLMVVMENYPNLKADQSFLNLQAQLEGTENRISVERDRYNESVSAYNTAIRGFFTSFVARRMGLVPKTFYESVKEAATAPQVKF